MIIRNNLASAPIKNYSLFFIACLVLGLAVVAFTILNAVSLTASNVKNSELEDIIQNQNQQLSNLEKQSKELQSKITRIKTPEFVSETEFMNNAIKRRTFSWTALFNHFEEVLPPSVKMVSVIPSVADRDISIKLEMAAQSLSDMLELVRILERDEAFSRVVLRGEKGGDGGLVTFSVSLLYTPIEKEATDEL